MLAARVRAACLALPDPDILDSFDQVYGETTDELVQQKAEQAAYLASFEASS